MTIVLPFPHTPMFNADQVLKGVSLAIKLPEVLKLLPLL
jgi:hypothetical protein